jgi:dihydroorotase
VTLLAPDAEVVIRATALRSKSKNTPFDGWTLKGAVAATIVGGRIVYVNRQLSGSGDLRSLGPSDLS